jgi:hypothetical protein
MPPRLVVHLLIPKLCVAGSAIYVSEAKLVHSRYHRYSTLCLALQLLLCVAGHPGQAEFGRLSHFGIQPDGRFTVDIVVGGSGGFWLWPFSS